MKCGVWDDYLTAAMSRRGSRGSILKFLCEFFLEDFLDLLFILDVFVEIYFNFTQRTESASNLGFPEIPDISLSRLMHWLRALREP